MFSLFYVIAIHYNVGAFSVVMNEAPCMIYKFLSLSQTLFFYIMFFSGPGPKFRKQWFKTASCFSFS